MSTKCTCMHGSALNLFYCSLLALHPGSKQCEATVLLSRYSIATAFMFMYMCMYIRTIWNVCNELCDCVPAYSIRRPGVHSSLSLRPPHCTTGSKSAQGLCHDSRYVSMYTVRSTISLCLGSIIILCTCAYTNAML